MSVVGSGGSADHLVASLTAISSYPVSLCFHLKVPNGFTSNRSYFGFQYSGDIGASEIKQRPQAGTTAGKIKVITTRDDTGSAEHSDTDDDAFDDDTWVSIVVVVNSATSVEVYYAGSLVSTITVSRDVLQQTWDRLYILNENNSANASDAKLAEVAVWDGVALNSTNATDLTTKTPHNIGNDPDYYWPLFDDIAADIGGADFTDGGTSSYTQDSGDHPSLTGPSAGSTTPLHYYRMMQS